MLNPRRVIGALKQNIAKVIVGKDEVIELALIAMLCKGHVLIEDVPGTGKTTWSALWPNRWTAALTASSLRRTWCPAMLRALPWSILKPGSWSFTPGR